MGRLEDVLEMIRCAQVNLDNLKATVPAIAYAPMFKVVELQLKQAEEACTGDEAPA